LSLQAASLETFGYTLVLKEIVMKFHEPNKARIFICNEKVFKNVLHATDLFLFIYLFFTNFLI